MNTLDNIKWLFFDLGSTLVDETAVYEARIDFALKHGNVGRDAFMEKVRECAKTSATAIRTAAALYGVALPPWDNTLERLYPNVEGILKTLSGKYKLGVIANQTLGTGNRLNNWGVRQYFDVIAASEEEGCAKPNVKLFQIALEAAGCKASEAVMIGDRLDNDIEPAKKLGMKTVWVRQHELVRVQEITGESVRPDFTVESIDELTALLM